MTHVDTSKLGPIEALEIARAVATRDGDHALAKVLSAEIKRRTDPAFDMWLVLDELVTMTDQFMYYTGPRLEKLTFPATVAPGCVQTLKLAEYLRGLQERARAARAAYSDERGWT